MDCDDDLMTSCSLRPAYARNGFRLFFLARNNARSSDLLSVDRCDERINHPESWIPILVASRVECQCVVHNNFEFSSEGERRESQSILDLGIASLIVNNVLLSRDSYSFSDNPEISPSLPALSRPAPLLAT
jgi:hypothetical protein